MRVLGSLLILALVSTPAFAHASLPATTVGPVKVGVWVSSRTSDEPASLVDSGLPAQIQHDAIATEMRAFDVEFSDWRHLDVQASALRIENVTPRDWSTPVAVPVTIPSVDGGVWVLTVHVAVYSAVEDTLVDSGIVVLRTAVANGVPASSGLAALALLALAAAVMKPPRAA